MRYAQLLLVLLLACPGAFGQTLQDLIAEDQLRLRSWLEPTADIVVGQEVRLVIEISTRRWFAGGTAIHPAEVRNLLILRRNQFATNLSRREEGTTWVVQQWQLELYPQTEGEFRVPGIGLELAVNTAESGIVRGRLETQPLTFTAIVPQLLRAADSWLATPSLEVSQSFDRELSGLQPGDALERTITLRATHVTSMMLPEPAIEELHGLAAYADNPKLQDRSNRGEATAERIERITYVVEESGQFRLPEQIFHYWDTSLQQAATANLAAVEIDAGQGAADGTVGTTPIEIRIELKWLLAPLVLIPAILLYRRRGRPEKTPARLLKQANRALRRGQAERAASLLYDWLNIKQPGTAWLSLRQSALAGSDPDLAEEIEGLLATVYGSTGGDRPLGKTGLGGLSPPAESRGIWRRLWGRQVQLELNPGSSAVERRESGSR